MDLYLLYMRSYIFPVALFLQVIKKILTPIYSLPSSSLHPDNINCNWRNRFDVDAADSSTMHKKSFEMDFQKRMNLD